MIFQFLNVWIFITTSAIGRLMSLTVADGVGFFAVAIAFVMFNLIRSNVVR